MDQTHPIYNVRSIFDNAILAPLDRQVGSMDDLRKTIGQKSDIVTDPENVTDPRLIEPGQFY